MQTCTTCNSTYDETELDIPSPIPDGMCAECGTQLTAEQVASLVAANAPDEE